MDDSESEEAREFYINELRRRLNESEARYATVLDIAPDAVIVVDAEQCIKIFNRRAEQIFGHAAEQVLGLPLDLLLPEQVVSIHQRHVQEFSTDGKSSKRMESRQVAIYGRRRDGTTFPAEVSIAKLIQNGEPAFVAVLRDISERRRLEGRLEAVHHLSSGESISPVEKTGLIIDLGRHVVTLEGHPLGLSPTEFDLLVYLRDKAPRVVSSQELVREVQKYENDPVEARVIVRYHIYRIRRKAKTSAGINDLIRTVRGIGYALGDGYR